MSSMQSRFVSLASTRQNYSNKELKNNTVTLSQPTAKVWYSYKKVGL